MSDVKVRAAPAPASAPAVPSSEFALLDGNRIEPHGSVTRVRAGRPAGAEVTPGTGGLTRASVPAS